MDHVGRIPRHPRQTCYHHLLISLLVLSGSTLPPTLSRPMLIPDSSAFPGKLREFYASLDEQFHCDFNRADLCNLRPEPVGSWSFAQSFRELAEQFSRAAEAAAAAAAATSGVGDTTGADGRAMVPDPVVVNHFACAVPPKQPNGTITSPYLYSTMDWSIPWPQFSSFTVPADRDEQHRNASVGSEPLPGLSSKPDSRSGVFTAEPQPPQLLACVHIRLRFPPNQSSQIQLSFSSLLQQIDLPPEHHTPRLPPSLHPPPPGIRQSLRPARQSLGIQVPRSTWTELTVPIMDLQTHTPHIAPTGDLSMAHRNDGGEPMTMFSAEQRTWVVRSTPTVLRLRTTPHVCVDDFRFHVWAHRLPGAHSDSPPPPDGCVRSLVWQDPVRRQKRTLLLQDERGTILEPDGDDAMRKANKKAGLRLRPGDPMLDRGLDWLPFAGSMLLAVASTVLFLLLVAAICGSVTLAQRRRFLHNPTPKQAPFPVDRSPGPSPYCRGRLPGRIARSESSKFEQEERELMFGGGDEGGDDSGSGRGDESLFQQSTSGTYHSSSLPGTPNEPANLDSGDVTNMSTVQLMRNWYFYRRRGQRARHQQQPQQQGLHPCLALPPTAVNPVHHPVAVRLGPKPPSGSNPLARLSLCVRPDGNLLLAQPTTGGGDGPPLASITEANGPGEPLLSSLLGQTAWHSHPSGSHTPSTLARSQLSVHSSTDSV